jgi:hypothetical protein
MQGMRKKLIIKLNIYIYILPNWLLKTEFLKFFTLETFLNAMKKKGLHICGNCITHAVNLMLINMKSGKC